MEISVKVDDIDMDRGVLNRAETYIISVQNVDNGDFESYQIDLGTETYLQEVDPLFEVLAKYGKRLDHPLNVDDLEEEEDSGELLPPAQRKAIESNGQGPILRPEDLPKALEGTTLVPSSRSPLFLPGGKPPEWLKTVRAICGVCKRPVELKNRGVHAGGNHGKKVYEVEWTLTGVPEGSEISECRWCGLPSPHLYITNNHERSCGKKRAQQK